MPLLLNDRTGMLVGTALHLLHPLLHHMTVPSEVPFECRLAINQSRACECPGT